MQTQIHGFHGNIGGSYENNGNIGNLGSFLQKHYIMMLHMHIGIGY